MATRTRRPSIPMPPVIQVGISLPDNFALLVAEKVAEASQRIAEGNRYVGLREACQITNMTRSSLRAAAEARLLPHYPGKGRDLEFKVCDLWSYKDQKRKETKL